MRRRFVLTAVVALFLAVLSAIPVLANLHDDADAAIAALNTRRASVEASWDTISAALVDMETYKDQMIADRATLEENEYSQAQLDTMDDCISLITAEWQSLNFIDNSEHVSNAAQHADQAQSWHDIGDWTQCLDECDAANSDYDLADADISAFLGAYTDPGSWIDAFYAEYDYPENVN